jgi:PAS domain S-box-containing protein
VGSPNGRDASGMEPDSLLSLLERLPNAVLVLDIDWRVTFANQEARRISRLEPTDLNSKTHWEMYPETLGTPVEAVYRQVMGTGVSSRLEYFYAPFSVWLDIHVLAMPGGIALHYLDITGRKRAEYDRERAQQQSEQAQAQREATARRLQQVLDVTSDGVVSVDCAWKFTFVNRSAAAMLGRDDLLGKQLWQEYPDAVGSEFDRNYRLAMERRIPAAFEAFYPAPLDSWLSLHCYPSDDGIIVFFRDVTEQHRSHQIFLEQRDLITFVQQASHTAFWRLDLATGTLTFDPGSYPVFGHPFSTLETAAAFQAIVHPDDRAVVSANVRRAVESSNLLVNEFRVIDPSGAVIWLEARSRAEILDGVPVTLGGMTIDITDRKRNEEALAASEQRYRVLTELSPQFLWMGSPAGEITYANQASLDYQGLTMDDLSGNNWLAAFPPEDQARVADAWRNAIATGGIYDIEARMIEARTRVPRWFWIRALPLRDEAGAITAWLGVAVDIHDRKTAADELHQRQLETERQRAELETLYRTAPIGLALFDPVEFRYLRLNDRQAEIVGLPCEEVLGKRLTEIAPIPGLDEMFQKVASGTPIRNALLEGAVATRPDDHRYWNVNYYPVLNPDGSVRAITAASLEITAQKKAEIALIQSEKLAAVGRLASSISHEINNPLEAVTNLLYLIGSDPALPADVIPYVNTAQSELQRVCQIATQTLRFHRQAVRATRVTAEELVGAVLNLYLGRLNNSGIEVQTRYLSRNPVLCLENDIRQVLNNLIDNAIGAMRHGGRLIARSHDATAFSPEHPGGRPGIRITIADTGHGMSPAVRARVFEPFFTTKALNGTGLGLWISSGIIARHGGRIAIRSSENPRRHGTVFTLFLPHISEADIESAAPLRP